MVTNNDQFYLAGNTSFSQWLTSTANHQFEDCSLTGKNGYMINFSDKNAFLNWS